MITDKTSKEPDWRPPDLEKESTANSDPTVEDLLKNYDFQALHDRIMMAIEIQTKIPTKDKMS